MSRAFAGRAGSVRPEAETWLAFGATRRPQRRRGGRDEGRGQASLADELPGAETGLKHGVLQVV